MPEPVSHLPGAFKLSAWAIEIPFLTCEKKVGCACLWCVINKGKNTENVGTALPEKGSPLGFLNLEPVLLFSHLKYYRKEKVSANLLILEVSFCLSFSLTPCVHLLVSQGENWHTKHHIERHICTSKFTHISSKNFTNFYQKTFQQNKYEYHSILIT